MAIATISLLITSGGSRSIASNSVSNHAFATTGSLLSIDVSIPLRNVLVKEGVAELPPPPPLPATNVAEVVEGVGWEKDAIWRSLEEVPGYMLYMA